MRILFTIPHYYRQTDRGFFGSVRTDAKRRLLMMKSCVQWLHQTFGRGQAEFSAEVALSKRWAPVNGTISADIQVIICTTGPYHLLDGLPAELFRHQPTDAEPLLLGYECHRVMAENCDDFDFFCFLEDDIVVNDSLLFHKLKWFNAEAGSSALLQPNRFEISSRPPLYKLYMDGPLKDRSLSARFQDASIRPRLTFSALGGEISFVRPNNTHSGCFFLSQDQMRHWISEPYFLDRSGAYHDPMASAATLGITRAFDIYKPALENAGFLEVFHLDNRYLGRAI